ncbi:uncharacterized protein LOC116267509 isoform X2 [Nymphaea colorata]|uniref:uncharacterized protein LOC116267509 isoform X2 n=1 Tax=Nymphaea colorata TaxID=210225 RepID=UPI00129D35EF|nr:uncharacterized protein LOC116267509 isoform X2 [Nymphaea colorata]
MEHPWNFRPAQAGLPRPPPFPPANSGLDFRHPHPLPGFENPPQPVFQGPFFDPPGHFRHDDRLLGPPGFHPGGSAAMRGFEHGPGAIGFVRPEFRVNPAQVDGHFPEQRRWDNPQVRGGISDPSSWNSFPGPNLDRRSLNDGQGNHSPFGVTSAPSVDRWNEKMQTAREGFDNRVGYTGNWGSLGYAGTFGDDWGAPLVGRGFEEQRLVENGTVHKRPRLENGRMVEYDEYGHPSSANAGKRSRENERISNLIRDHGGYSGPVGQEKPTSHYPLDGSFDATSFQGRPHLPEGAQNRWSGVDQLRELSMNGARSGLDMEHQRRFGNEFPAILQPELGSPVPHGVGLSQSNLGSGNYGSHGAAGNPQSNDHPERGIMQNHDHYHHGQISHDSDKLASGVYSKDRENHFLSQQMLPQTLSPQPLTQMRVDPSGHANQRMLDHTDQSQEKAISHQEQANSNKQDQFFLPPSIQGFSKVDPQMSQFASDHDGYSSRVYMASKNSQLPLLDNSFGTRHPTQQLRDGHRNYHTVETGKLQHPQTVIGTPNESHGQQDMALPLENSRRNFGQGRHENYFFPEMGPASHLRNRPQMSQPLLGALPLAGESPAPPYPSSHESQITAAPLPALKYPGLSSTSSVLPSSVAIPGHVLSEARPSAQGCHASLPTIPFPREGQSLHVTEEVQPLSLKKSPVAKPKVVDATHLFMLPHRTTRPDHIVVILRGLPGSGKSYLVKALRDLEVSNGGNAPRIHSMDDYFMTEVEKDEESESSKTSGAVKGKRTITKKVMEYCYEPEMEEAYRASMLKAFKKTLEDGIFKFVIVDDRNLRVADFAQFWATAKRSGYEVYILEATYRDIAGCAARNVHGFTSEDIQKMANKWEHTPPLYLQLNTQSLFHGDDLNDRGIAEVEMDMEEVDCSMEEPLLKNDEKFIQNPDSPSPDYEYEGHHSGIGQRWQAEISDSLKEVKEIEKSKWSKNMDEVADVVKPPKNTSQTALSGLIQAYGKGDKSIRWGDNEGRSGFAIGVGKKSKSLIIGPGAGYNLFARNNKNIAFLF